MSESTKPIPELTAKAKEPVCGDDPEFCRWFKRLCISDLLIRAEKDPLYWQGRPLNWDALTRFMPIMSMQADVFHCSGFW